MRLQSRHSERGSALVSTLVAIGLMAVIIPTSIKSFANLDARRKKIDFSLKELDIQEMILASVDCSKVAECTKDALIDLKGTTGDILISKSGDTVIGKIALQAVCVSKTSFEIRRAVINPSGTFAKDPMTQKALDWDNPQARLFGSDELCSDKVKIGVDPFFELTGSVCTTGKYVFGNGGGIIAPSSLKCLDGTFPELKTCPSGSTTQLAYWDRSGNWGDSGNWVTRCMK